jgi:hypothetical protein
MNGFHGGALYCVTALLRDCFVAILLYCVVRERHLHGSRARRCFSRSGIWAHTCHFSASVARLQPPISGKVRKQPSHQPALGCIKHKDTQGEGTELGAGGCGSANTCAARALSFFQ